MDIKPGLITKVLKMQHSDSVRSVSCILGGMMCLLTCPLPLCNHENNCPSGQLLSSEQCLITFAVDYYRCKVHMLMSVNFNACKSQGYYILFVLLVRILIGCPHLYDS